MTSNSMILFILLLFIIIFLLGVAISNTIYYLDIYNYGSEVLSPKTSQFLYISNIIVCFLLLLCLIFIFYLVNINDKNNEINLQNNFSTDDLAKDHDRQIIRENKTHHKVKKPKQEYKHYVEGEVIEEGKSGYIPFKKEIETKSNEELKTEDNNKTLFNPKIRKDLSNKL
jgi:uncharacterized membrane protein